MASKAFPPFFKISVPMLEASSLAETIMAFCVTKPRLLLVFEILGLLVSLQEKTKEININRKMSLCIDFV
ncbi:hypothetical protein GCM10022271_20540 [Corallibacter vietnamensis]|uniref:Uncharacterized protein n=1 Tax=Corallibacter vietnamensis TaxID=904130 RepID=A0ABP7HFK1_9FLAO